MPSATYSVKDIGSALAQTGIAVGDTVVMHSSLFHLGQLEGVPIKECPARVVQAICDHLGEEGTLAVPAPNWDYGQKRQPFDIRHTPVTKSLGVIGNHMIKLPDARRSPNPIFSIAAVGPQAGTICEGGVATAFGVDSAWDRMFSLNADMLFLGCDISVMTFVRYIEHRFGVPYLYNKLFDVPILDNGKPLDMAVVALLRYAHCPVQYDLSGLERLLREAGALREASLGGAKVHAVRMDKCFAIAVEALKKDIHFFLGGRPNYVAGQVPVV